MDGQRDLGALYATGDWTGPHDAVRAAEWYRGASERGHADAQYNLGFMYLLGEGVPGDPGQGLRWLRLAADQGEEASFRLLADLYRNGYHGVSLDPAEAARWDERYRPRNRVPLKRQKLSIERWTCNSTNRVIENAFGLAATRRLTRPMRQPWLRFARWPTSC